LNIRNANLDDVHRLIEIYAYYVVNTAITFEYDIPSLEDFSNRMNNTIKSYPYLVLEENGIIQGYAYAGAFHERAAYSRCCELSIYLDHNATGKGYGRMLYTALENELKQAGKLNLYACIGSPIVEDEYLTNNSEQFHHHLGFKKIGEFHKCGYKFGRWYNMIWMEKFIGQHI
jgi:phosphinothricin acetyltransferase